MKARRIRKLEETMLTPAETVIDGCYRMHVGLWVLNGKRGAKT
jgi:hypothetical protein